MQHLSTHISIVLDQRLYLKDPQSSTIGLEIVRQSVDMIATSGLDHFTFKKLAQVLKSTESTIYRYFQNKHQLAMYLASWHWSHLEWRIAFATANIQDPQQRLEKALLEISTWVKDNPRTKYLDESKLQRLVLTEGFKAFVPVELSKSDKEGYLSAYSFLCARLSDIIQSAIKHCAQPKALAVMIIESVHHQMYLQLHLPQLSEIKMKDTEMVQFITTHLLKSTTKK